MSVKWVDINNRGGSAKYRSIFVGTELKTRLPFKLGSSQRPSNRNVEIHVQQLQDFTSEKEEALAILPREFPTFHAYNSSNTDA